MVIAFVLNLNLYATLQEIKACDFFHVILFFLLRCFLFYVLSCFSNADSVTLPWERGVAANKVPYYIK